MTDGFSTSPPHTLIDELNSHWAYVMGRVGIINPSRQFGGICQARDWPMQKAQDQTFYMSVGDGKPSRSVNSWQGPLYTYAVRWCWIVIGTDLSQTTDAASRGDRYVINMTMQSELLNGLWPGFCQKQQYSIQDNGAGVAVLVATPFPMYETVWWSKPDWQQRQDTQTGITFGYGAVAVSGFSPEINS